MLGHDMIKISYIMIKKAYNALVSLPPLFTSESPEFCPKTLALNPNGVRKPNSEL